TALSTLSLHDALPIYRPRPGAAAREDRRAPPAPRRAGRYRPPPGSAAGAARTAPPSTGQSRTAQARPPGGGSRTRTRAPPPPPRSEEHTSELQSLAYL